MSAIAATWSRCAAPRASSSVMRTANGDTFPVREWLAADADARTPTDPSLKDGVTCDEIGCVARLARWRGRGAAVRGGSLRGGLPPCGAGRQPATAPPSCAATAIDRTVWLRTGATALYRAGSGWERVVAYPPGYDRPWARAAAARGESEASPHVSAARCNAAGRGSRRRGLSSLAQYFRNSPTSLPCTRTRLGGRMRTS